MNEMTRVPTGDLSPRDSRIWKWLLALARVCVPLGPDELRARINGLIPMLREEPLDAFNPATLKVAVATAFNGHFPPLATIKIALDTHQPDQQAVDADGPAQAWLAFMRRKTSEGADLHRAAAMVRSYAPPDAMAAVALAFPDAFSEFTSRARDREFWRGRLQEIASTWNPSTRWWRAASAKAQVMQPGSDPRPGLIGALEKIMLEAEQAGGDTTQPVPDPWIRPQGPHL